MGQTSTNAPASGHPQSALADRYCAGDPFARRLLEAASEPVALAGGQPLFRQGDPGDSMYLLLRGHLTIQIEHADGTQTALAELGPGTPVGEMALLTGQARTASVYAATDAELIRCSRTDYERLAAAYPDELALFLRVVTRRTRELQAAGALTGLFGPLDAEILAWLLGELEWIELCHGDVLFSEGDPGDGMYLVVSGRLRASVMQPGGEPLLCGEVAPGEPVGEMALLSGEPRSATVASIRETHLVKMTQAAYERLANHRPAAILRLARLIIERQQQSLRGASSATVRALVLTLVPAGGDAPLVAFAEELAACLEAHGPVLLLDSSRLDEALGKPGAARAEPDHPTGLVVSAWLSEQEGRYRYLLCVADADWSVWTERCVSQADRLLVLADARARPDRGPVEQAIASRNLPVRRELILLHPATTDRPSGTAAWLDGRNLHAHHHVRRGDAAHMSRLARRLTGRALGLALSGGAARGFAHVGVLRAMEGLGIEIDLVGGTSMGGLIGGLYALEVGGLDAVQELARRYANPKQLFDYTLPLVSLMSSRKLTRVMRTLYGDACIEDLWRPFFCVSSNLTRAEAVIHRSGRLWAAVRSSIAIPGVWTPMLRGSDVLADGGAMNNFPVDVMVRLCEGGPVVGSNVCPLWEMPYPYEFGPSINGWQVLWSRINPFTPGVKAPSLLASLMRAQEVRSVSSMRHAESLASVLIRPDVRGFAVLDFTAFEPIIETGYQEARQVLADWLRAR